MAGSQSSERVHLCCRCSHPQTQNQTHAYTHCLSQGWDSSLFSPVPLPTVWPSRLLWDPMGLWDSCGALWRSGVPLELPAQTQHLGVLLLLICPGASLCIPSRCHWFSGQPQLIGIDLANLWVLLLGRCLLAFPWCHLNNETVFSHSVLWCCQTGCISNSICGDGTSPQ